MLGASGSVPGDAGTDLGLRQGRVVLVAALFEVGTLQERSSRELRATYLVSLKDMDRNPI